MNKTVFRLVRSEEDQELGDLEQKIQKEAEREREDREDQVQTRKREETHVMLFNSAK